MKLIACLSITVLSLFSLRENTHQPGARQNSQAHGFAVVELFTSEGCSSCPPADEALAQIKMEYGDNVHVLSFHVDYWDYLGWKDAFSNTLYSTRQQQYASVFRLESIYTPQVIVNGSKEFVGSDKPVLQKTITESLRAIPGKALKISAYSAGNKEVTVKYETAADDRENLDIALIQSHATSDVKRGENKGRILKHVNVVRNFKTISLDKMGTGSMELELPAGSAKDDFKIIAWLQDKHTLYISGATESPIQ
jgi:hypothetical protein